MANLGSIPALIQKIIQHIKANGNNDITGPKLQVILIDVVDTLNALMGEIDIQSGAIFAVNPIDETMVTDNTVEGVAGVRANLEFLQTLFADTNHGHSMNDIEGLLTALSNINTSLNVIIDVLDDKENDLGSPDVDGKGLVSTAAGERSWVQLLTVDDIPEQPPVSFDNVRTLGIGPTRIFIDENQVGSLVLSKTDMVIPPMDHLTFEDEPGFKWVPHLLFEWHLYTTPAFGAGHPNSQFQFVIGGLAIYAVKTDIGLATFDDPFYGSKKFEIQSPNNNTRPIIHSGIFPNEIVLSGQAYVGDEYPGGILRLNQLLTNGMDAFLAYSYGMYKVTYQKTPI